MNHSRLLSAMLKLALDTNQVQPSEVMAILQQKQQGGPEDKNTETVDGDIIGAEAPLADMDSNLEGKILETAFPELEVEDAIEQAKEMKQLNQPITQEGNFGGQNGCIQKAGSLWDVLKARHK